MLLPTDVSLRAEIEELEVRLFHLSCAELRDQVEYSQRLSKLLSLLESQCSSYALCLHEAAFKCGAEKNHLNVLLRKATGFTFHQLLTRFRLLRATLMMRSSDSSLLGIAQECGFGSISSLERNFFHIFHETPREYRKRHPHHLPIRVQLKSPGPNCT